MNKLDQRIVLILLVSLLVLAGSTSVSAATFRTGDDVVIGAAEEIDDDLYVAGRSVTVDGKVTGDLIACAAVVTLNGSVGGDLVGCGQAILISGQVADDVRTAGMIIRLGPDARIGDDVIAAGYSLESMPGSLTSGTLRFAGYQARMAGMVLESLEGTMDRLDLVGTVDGDVQVTIGGKAGGPSPAQFFPTPVPIPSVPSGLTLADSTQIGGELLYTSTIESTLPTGASIGGGVTRMEPAIVAEPEASLTATLLGHARRFVALFVVGLLVLWIAPSWTARVTDTVGAKPLASLGWGALGVVAFGVGILAVALAVVVVALVVGFLTLGRLVGLTIVLGLLAEIAWVAAFWLIASFAAPIVVGFWFGKQILRRSTPDRVADAALPLLIGLIGLTIVTAIPYLGPLVGFVIVLLGIGSLWLSRSGAARPSASVALKAA